MKKWVSIVLGLTLSATSMAATKAQQRFIDKLQPVVDAANQTILRDRAKLLSLELKRQSTSSRLSAADKRWVRQLARQYRVRRFKVDDLKNWALLSSRVDVVPAAIVIAQSINESAWGRSRFAKDANNYFGQWCYTKGCGLVPKKRPGGAHFEVKKFNSMADSVRAYMHNLNTNQNYTLFREKRFELRQAQKKLDPYILVDGLYYYSQGRGNYVKSIDALISHYKLDKLDRADKSE